MLLGFIDGSGFAELGFCPPDPSEFLLRWMSKRPGVLEDIDARFFYPS